MLLFVIETFPLGEEDRVAREEGQQERGRGSEPEARTRCRSRACVRGFVLYAWMNAWMLEDNR